MTFSQRRIRNSIQLISAVLVSHFLTDQLVAKHSNRCPYADRESVKSEPTSIYAQQPNREPSVFNTRKNSKAARNEFNKLDTGLLKEFNDLENFSIQLTTLSLKSKATDNENQDIKISGKWCRKIDLVNFELYIDDKIARGYEKISLPSGNTHDSENKGIIENEAGLFKIIWEPQTRSHLTMNSTWYLVELDEKEVTFKTIVQTTYKLDSAESSTSTSEYEVLLGKCD